MHTCISSNLWVKYTVESHMIRSLSSEIYHKFSMPFTSWKCCHQIIIILPKTTWEIFPKRYFYSRKIMMSSHTIFLFHVVWEEIKNNAWVTMNNDFWVTSEAIYQRQSHSWKSLAKRIMSDPKIVIHGNECIILFLTCHFMSWTHYSAKNNHRSLISQLSPRTVVSDFIVTSPQLICGITWT